MKRNIIRIDQEKCNGCGLCIPECPEGAIQIIDGKARLVSDLLCDGLGACLGHCPEGAITVEEREAEPYDQRKVMALIVPQGMNTIRSHLKHLQDHGKTEYYAQAMACLAGQNFTVAEENRAMPHHSGCPVSRTLEFHHHEPATELSGQRPSQLTHWPIQMHLLSPRAPHFRNSDLVLAADCTAFSLGDFHKDYLKGKTLAIACPKLDDGQEVYLEKLKALIDEAQINTLTVIIMQVPCCGGLLRMAQTVMQQCRRKVPIKVVVVGIQGDILQEEWL